MEQQAQNSQDKDPKLWAMAKQRAAFKKDLVYYMVINAFLWVIWAISNYNDKEFDGGIPWPIWPTVGWGIAMIIEYFSVYKFPKEITAEKEYEKLKNNNKNY
ncbi:hypothetical protein CAP36_17120 [Chitinophagaceae bacterium IBVUCB2]|nr:hypothetical protein CAP36_17120 [Chitinophagaceae bacterium IBVUCB2]